MMMDMESVSLRDDVNGEERGMRSERQHAKLQMWMGSILAAKTMAC